MTLQTPPSPARRDLRGIRRRGRRRPVVIAAGIAFGLVAAAGVTGTAAASHRPEATIAQPAAPEIVLASQIDATDAEPTDPAAQAQAVADQSLAAAAAVTADIAAAGLDIGIADTTVDTAALEDAAERLELADALPAVLVPSITDDVAEEAAVLDARVAELRGGLDGALERKAAEEAAAAAAAEEEARRAAAAAPAAGRSSAGAGGDALPTAAVPSGGATGDNSPAGAQATAYAMLAGYGWGDDQFGCLVALWNRESGWNYQAHNRSSGAHGIPQALPGSKMASAGPDWETNAATQIAWGFGYIAGRYGSPCAAWSHSESVGWY